MHEPIVFISHFRVKQGKFDGLRQLHQQVAKVLEAEKPGTITFLGYANAEGSEGVSYIHMFPDADSMDLHVQGAAERAKVAHEFMEPDGVEIYGRPSDSVLEMMRQRSLNLKSQYLGGFIRLKS